MIKLVWNVTSRSQPGRLTRKAESVLLQSVPHRGFHGVPQGWARGKQVTNLIQVSHPDVVQLWWHLLYRTRACMCLPCQFLQAVFDTITFPPLPVCHLFTFNLPIKICCFCSTCHVRCMFSCCWPWGSHGEQTSHWHCFSPGRHTGKRSWMGGCAPSKGPRSESFQGGSPFGSGGSQGIRADLPPPALLPAWGCWGPGEKRCRYPLSEKGRLLPPSLGVQCDRKKTILILMVLTTLASADLLLSALPWLCVYQLPSCPWPQFWKPLTDLLCDLLTHEAGAQGGSETPGFTLFLGGVGSAKPLPAQGALATFLLCNLVLPKVLPPQLQRWWWKAKKGESNQLKRLRERS